MSASYLHQIVTGDRDFKVGSEFARKLSDALGVKLSHWAPFTSDGHLVADDPTPVSCPMFGWVGAGPGVEGDAEEGTIEVPPHLSRADGVYRVRGTSMVGAGIEDGDYIAVRKDPEPQDREMVVAYVGGYGTVIKMLRHKIIGGRTRTLISQNGSNWQHDIREGDAVYGVFIGAFRPKPPEKKKAPKSKKS